MAMKDTILQQFTRTADIPSRHRLRSSVTDSQSVRSCCQTFYCVNVEIVKWLLLTAISCRSCSNRIKQCVIFIHCGA